MHNYVIANNVTYYVFACTADKSIRANLRLDMYFNDYFINEYYLSDFMMYTVELKTSISYLLIHTVTDYLYCKI